MPLMGRLSCSTYEQQYCNKSNILKAAGGAATGRNVYDLICDIVVTVR